MSLKAISLALLTGAITVATVGLVAAQSPATPPATPPAATAAPASPPAPSAFKPSLGDLMTMTIQPRHTKLGLAGQEKNWSYAAYALHELEESFEGAAEVWPVYGKTNVGELMEATTKEPMEALAAAIKSGNAPKFTEAYARLTATCNACHQATERGFIVIQAPRGTPFPDQDFRPQKP